MTFADPSSTGRDDRKSPEATTPSPSKPLSVNLVKEV
jgi:hypothetical protein